MIVSLKFESLQQYIILFIGFPGQFRRFVIPFDEGVIQIREGWIWAMKFVVQICISVIQIRTSVKKFSVYIIQIQIRVESIQIRHRSGQRLTCMTVLRTCCIFREFERHKFRFEWRQCKFECWENKIEWRIGCAWPKSSKLNAHKMNLSRQNYSNWPGLSYYLKIPWNTSLFYS